MASEDDVTVDAVIDHWLRKRAVGGRLDGWVRDYVAKCVEWIRKEVISSFNIFLILIFLLIFVLLFNSFFLYNSFLYIF